MESLHGSVLESGLKHETGDESGTNMDVRMLERRTLRGLKVVPCAFFVFLFRKLLSRKGAFETLAVVARSLEEVVFVPVILAVSGDWSPRYI